MDHPQDNEYTYPEQAEENYEIIEREEGVEDQYGDEDSQYSGEGSDR